MHMEALLTTKSNPISAVLPHYSSLQDELCWRQPLRRDDSMPGALKARQGRSKVSQALRSHLLRLPTHPAMPREERWCHEAEKGQQPAWGHILALPSLSERDSSRPGHKIHFNCIFQPRNQPASPQKHSGSGRRFPPTADHCWSSSI